MDKGKRIHLKPYLSIKSIGKLRFWTGIGLGVLSAFLFFWFIFFILELVDLFRVIQHFDLPIKNDSQLLFEKLFLLSLSIAFGNNTMLKYWFVKPTKYFNKTYKYSSHRIVNYSLFIEYVVLFAAISFITRFLLYAPFIDLNIFNEYGYILYLFPVYLFFIAWTEVSRYIKTQRWMLYVFGISSIFMILCSFIDISNYKIGEKAFRAKHYDAITYIESEVEKAEQKYSITFSDETILSLKELKTANTLNLIEKTRLAFKTEGKVSLDTIILEKIIVHNFKGFYKDYRNSYTYITPFQAYKQLRKVDSKSPEATQLLDIINEFHQLSLFIINAEDENDSSILHYQKSKILKDNLYSIDYLKYRNMYDQTAFLVYHLQKLGKYKHPLITTEIPYPPPPPIFNRWIEKSFPEFGEDYNLEN